MRDPQATLEIRESDVARRLKQPLENGHFLTSALARDWAMAGQLVPFDLVDSVTVQALKIPFVTQPSEWCDAQLHDAARLTLDLQLTAVAQNFDMKDASAWNVIFAGTRPLFCDLLSFVPLAERKWWAAGQFARHFILPLALSRVRGQHARTTFQVSRDGMQPEEARRLFGASRFLTRFWPAMAGGDKAAPAGPVPTRPLSGKELAAVPAYRRSLHETLSWMIDGARPAARTSSAWSDYRAHRTHYPEGSVELKRHTIRRWLDNIRPGWTLDLGCNTGEFSRMATEAGSAVVALDGDHDAIQSLYLASKGAVDVYPLLANLDDMSGGRGWAGQEHPGLMARLEGRFDAVFMLALLHHLIVSSSIPLHAVAQFVRRCTRRWAILEWIDEADPQMRLLCGQRQRSPSEFTPALQRQAFLEAGFSIEDEVTLGQSGRQLALLKRTT